MTRKIFWPLALILVLIVSSVHAESLTGDSYTDVPTAMTQDSVLELSANENCAIRTLSPNVASIALLDDVYRFVWEEKNRPARYYDEETQQEISRLADGIDIDLLHMTEAMRLELSGSPALPVTAKMLLDVDYQVGQLVIVVLGIPEADDAYAWYPYRGRVEKEGEIQWDIPADEWALLSAQPVSFHVLTDRIGPRGGRLWGYEEYREKTPPAFSKDSGDVIKMRYWYTEWGEKIEDNFRLWLVDLTDAMKQEVARMGQHVADSKPILDYFPQDRKDEALLMLPDGVDESALIAYDIIALRDENYKDTYGDVNAQITFSTGYLPEKAMIILAGFPVKDAAEAPFMEWFVLRAEALESDDVEIGLKQLNLIRMEKEPMMLVVISQPVDAQ